VTDLTGRLVTSSSPLGQPQKTPNNQTSRPVLDEEQLVAAGRAQMLPT